MISGWGTIFHLVPLTSRDLGGRPKAIGLASTRNTSARLTCRQMELNRAGGACLTVERRSHSIVVKDGRKFGIGLAMVKFQGRIHSHAATTRRSGEFMELT